LMATIGTATRYGSPTQIQGNEDEWIWITVKTPT
jgi:hypothetical protein